MGNINQHITHQVVGHIKHLTWLFCALFIQVNQTFAQADSVVLDQVLVESSLLLDYTAGQKVEKIDLQHFGTLAGTLNESNGLYFKNYGNDQLSTIAFRGTTASQTAVLWNNIEVSSPTLGQTDFSIWPNYLLSDVTLVSGGVSAGFGTGSIGGAVVLNDKPMDYSDATSLDLLLKHGSFGRSELGAGLLKSSHKFSSQTKVYSKYLDNDFPYQVGDSTHHQVNAAVNQQSVGQKLGFKIDKRSTISMDLMAIKNHRQIQPPVGIPNSQTLSDKAINTALHYLYTGEKFTAHTTLGTIYQDQRYVDTVQIKTVQHAWRNEIELTPSNNLQIKPGVVVNQFEAQSDVFAKNVVEYRSDLYCALNIDLWHHTKLSANLRQGIYDNRFAPFSPSVGLLSTLYRDQKIKVNTRINGAKSYRVPTLNDRYWRPNDNPNVRPESGYNAELGIDFALTHQDQTLELSATHYRSWIHDMIVWMSTGSYFSPNNLRDVNINGLETSLNYDYQFGPMILQMSGQYSYTASTIQNGLSAAVDLGKGNQLPYIPFHAFGSELSVQLPRWSMQSSYHYTGLRFHSISNSERDEIEGFGLVNLLASMEFKTTFYQARIGVEIKNALDTSYQNYLNYAQPGRNYAINIQINFNK